MSSTNETSLPWLYLFRMRVVMHIVDANQCGSEYSHLMVVLEETVIAEPEPVPLELLGIHFRVSEDLGAGYFMISDSCDFTLSTRSAAHSAVAAGIIRVPCRSLARSKRSYLQG
jgi:hypothetical protein